MVSQFVELKLTAALQRRLSAIAEAGVLGRTIDEVVLHFTREALHRDWLARDVQREQVPIPSPPGPRLPVQAQPAQAAVVQPQRDGKRLIRAPEVCRRIGIGRSSLYKMVNSEAFPKSKKLGCRTVDWLESEVDAWIDFRAASAGGFSD